MSERVVADSTCLDDTGFYISAALKAEVLRLVEE